ncbi:Transcriptional regulator [Bacillus cereus R309803]|nr:Transcriptional regulator [Bacillus cereus R309803]
MTESEMKFRDTTIRNFFDKEDRLKAIPSQKKKKLVLLEHLVSK